MTAADGKTKVLHIVGNLRFGGTQVVLKQIVENGDKTRFDHFVYPLRVRDDDLPLRHTRVFRHAYFNYDIRKFFDLINICKREQIDIVHSHLHKSVLGGLLLTWFCDVPVIVHEHGPITRHGLTYALYRQLLRFLHHRSAAVIANSNAISQALSRVSRIPTQKITVIPNAVDLQRFQPRPELRKRLRNEYSLHDSDIVIGFAGRLVPVKGIDRLVDAMHILVKKNPAFHLFIVGAGLLESKLIRRSEQAQLDGHIHFLGFRSDVSEIMNVFDIGCMPSRQEAFGITAMEMMSMRIPLVCTNVEGLGEFTQNRRTALHLDSIQPEEIAETILELAGNEKLKTDLQQNAFEYCRQFSIAAFVSQVETLYRQLTCRD
jgi:glycosyltransferase involved in cell wall biosynthesis